MKWINLYYLQIEMYCLAKDSNEVIEIYTKDHKYRK